MLKLVLHNIQLDASNENVAILYTEHFYFMTVVVCCMQLLCLVVHAHCMFVIRLCSTAVDLAARPSSRPVSLHLSFICELWDFDHDVRTLET